MGLSMNKLLRPLKNPYGPFQSSLITEISRGDCAGIVFPDPTLFLFGWESLQEEGCLLYENGKGSFTPLPVSCRSRSTHASAIIAALNGGAPLN